MGHDRQLLLPGQKYPAGSFLAKDPYQVIAHKFVPVSPAALVDLYQAGNWDPGSFPAFPGPVYYPDLIEPPGSRSLIAIGDEAGAAAFRFPVAALPNDAGRYVQPTTAAMAAAVRAMIPAGSGTSQVNLHSTDPAVYPLTMVIYAMVPARGLDHATAAAIAASSSMPPAPARPLASSPASSLAATFRSRPACGPRPTRPPGTS